MLTGLVAYVLNNYLGKYVENIDQLSIAILSGKVELENLPLKKDALYKLGLPIFIKSGFIGKVKLQIPVKQIRSAPWVIVFEKLYVVASPIDVEEWDCTLEEQARHKQKLNALDSSESEFRSLLDSKETSYYASSYFSWLGYVSSLVSDIIENLQLEIQDVHIRYEDFSDVTTKPFAFGVTIEKFATESCDANWSPCFSSASGEESFKLLQLENFGFYWIDLDSNQKFSDLRREDLEAVMDPETCRKTIKDYILPPVSAQARVKRNRSEKPLRSNTPRIVCDLILQEVSFILIDWQYNQIVKCVKGLNDIDRIRGYRRYKPSCTIKEDPKAYWFYAISCLYPGQQPNICKPKVSWETCLCKGKENIKYVEIYRRILNSPNTVLTPEEKNLKDSVEWDRELEVLKALREIALKSVKSSQTVEKEEKPGKSILQGWFPNWIGWYMGTSETSNETSLEEEIYQAIADSAENNTIFKRDAVFGKFNFCLEKGSLNLCASIEDSKETNSMLELEFKGLSLNILSKPRFSSHLVELSLATLSLKDKITKNTMFPILVGPPGLERGSRSRALSPRVSFSSSYKLEEQGDLFYLSYENNPFGSICDYKLCVKSKSLDVVYQPNAVRWLTEFLCFPHQRDITHSRIEAMKTRTKKELMKNWEQILDGRIVARTCWEIDLDISAPQIILVEQFSDPNSSMAVIDFGRLQIQNTPFKQDSNQRPEFLNKDSEDDDTFLTPCSTPPQSQSSDTAENLELMSQLPSDLNESNLYQKLYDSYSLELTDLQVLVGKVNDNWRYAHNKGSSKMHVLDKFNISLKIERRIIFTSDPQFPSLTVNANLPKLVAHVNENKINAARNLIRVINAIGLPSPFRGNDNGLDFVEEKEEEEESSSVETSVEMSRLVIMQFTVDQLSLEVQSRERCVAELQVSGVKLSLTKQIYGSSITLTVHSLLLVDALQTFGPDFELLVASHKHVGMDSVSGSLRDSEPTSPTSPASPDPSAPRLTSASALSKALSSLATSPPRFQTHRGPFLDAEALITIEIELITTQEPKQVANIQFNNLDIIANQETIVELVGFVQRVFPKSQKPSGINLTSIIPSSVRESTESLSEIDSPSLGCTEITFDFHRLNVLLLRGIVKDGKLLGKKIGTATMSETKIQATISSELEVQGSLGGLQVLDLTPEGHMHQRILSVGRDPLLETPHPMYLLGAQDERTAFSFNFVRKLGCSAEKDSADVIVRMASLWYTHNPQFVNELQTCATEFKQYLSNLARSIKSAATDVALGLVHARTEALLAQSLYMNAKLSSSIYGSALSLTDCASPRKRKKSGSVDASGYATARDTNPQTPHSPAEEDDFIIDINFDIELDSPVVVLPRANNNTEVFVAHLGKITIRNSYEDNKESVSYSCEERFERYDFEIKDMNLFSLDTSSRRVPGPMIPKPENLYNCQSLAKPILHDTVIQIEVRRELKKLSRCRSSESNILLEDDEDEVLCSNYIESEAIHINGSVVTALKVSLTRTQYEQVLDTVQWLSTSHNSIETQGISRVTSRLQNQLSDIIEEDTGVATLSMDPHVRAKLFPSINQTKPKIPDSKPVSIKIGFDLPAFIVELRGDSPTGEQALVDLSFRDFVFTYEKCHKYETNIQVSLRSIYMEDLLQPQGSKQRSMVVSSSEEVVAAGVSCVSRSCPDVSYWHSTNGPLHGSLPDHLEPVNAFGIKNSMQNNNARSERESFCPCTPPPSPLSKRGKNERNLVLISTLLVDPSAPNFAKTYNSMQRCTSVDFNCLDLVISVESWVVVIDFFSAVPSVPLTKSLSNLSTSSDEQKVAKEKSETTIKVRSLSVVLIKPEYEIAKANISLANIVVKTCGLEKTVEGKLGVMSLVDLTLHGQLYREKFMTSREKGLVFYYNRHAPGVHEDYDAKLTLNMFSVMLVYTKRFVAEIQAFFDHFTQLQSVMKSIRLATSGQLVKDEPTRLLLEIHARPPMILLPESSKSNKLLIVDLGELLVSNCFKFSGDEGTISAVASNSERKCLLDVMTIQLENMDLYAGVRENDLGKDKADSFKFGSFRIVKRGPSLLTQKIRLKLQMESNLYNNICHNVPDKSIYGFLSTLDGTLDVEQYRLIRGFLAFNLGEESVPQIQSQPSIDAEPNINDIWTNLSLKLDLQNVTLRLVQAHESPPLACINFIKSRLLVESFSDNSQDIDLVSQEILITDTRQSDSKGKKNVFSNILQPVKNYKQHELQAEIHNRRRNNKTKSSILLNNMRLMAVFDWWEAVRGYIFQDIENPFSTEQKLPKVKQSSDVFELKLNITDSEIVVVEDSSQWDSNAVILKSTTILSYKPQNPEKPLSCVLNNCEMFSCILGIEEETALSIIDPVTVHFEVNGDEKLEVQVQFLTVRLSYHDMCMFRQMLSSIPQQFFSKDKESEELSLAARNQIQKLKGLGFDVKDCVKALEECDFKLDEAALWLTYNATASSEDKNDSSFKITSCELKSSCVSLCIIDDCGDSDVPLLELSFNNLHVEQCLPNHLSDIDPQGCMDCTLSSDYYNRELSGWEPILEPWKCKMTWIKSLSKDLTRNRLNIQILSEDIFNINITSTFLDLYKQVKDNWTKDYYNTKTNETYRSRSPFIPFALKNETGSELKFATTISDLNYSSDLKISSDEQWVTVAPGEMKSFSLRTRDKIRHQDSHKTRLHQLWTKVEGWQQVSPVTIDKVGTFFRHANAEIKLRNQREIPPARIVFDVALEGSARKLITVRSALLLINRLNEAVEVKLESRLPQDAVTLWVPISSHVIDSGGRLAVPLEHAHSQINIRPIIDQVPYTFCSPALSWLHMSNNTDLMYELKSCHSHKGGCYRFCAEIQRERHLAEKLRFEQPAHTIVLLPGIKLVNLLPVDFGFSLCGDRGRVKAGRSMAITNIFPDKSVNLEIALEGFKKGLVNLSPPFSNEYTSRVRFEDDKGRKLYLIAVISPNKGAKLKITLSASYWIINRTGLPLVFKQSGSSGVGAGQFEDHERARMMVPLLFSFSDNDASQTINARIGNQVIKNGVPQWCANFHVSKGIQVRKLHVTMTDGGKDEFFVVGLEVRPGKGKYRATSILTISPRFQLHNRSSYQLLFAQSCFVKSFSSDKSGQKNCLKLMQDSHMPFHWPRLEKEQLLCVSIQDVEDCCWSGGLAIDDNKSLHVNIRDTNGRVYFLRLEVVLQRATFFIVFTDADTMPPPIRIDNFSEVSIQFAQNFCKDVLHSTARAHSSVPYAWDQPTKPHLITLVGPGGVSHTYDIYKIGPAQGLTYENFIYIAFVGTFKQTQGLLDPPNVQSQELVLDVLKDNQIVLSRKMQGQRSQLWRLTPEGYLQHEGSSPPAAPNQQRSDMLVLDIESFAPQPDHYSRLMLRRIDPRRESTQTWRFTEEGRLQCKHCNLCVQAQDGFFGLRPGSAAVLGLPQPVCHQYTDKGIPLEQAIDKQYLRAGSGELSVEILMDGPTSVICIKDKNEKNHDEDRINKTIVKKSKFENLDEEDNKEFQFCVKLKGGIGISLVCRRTPEELLYALFSNIVGETTLTPLMRKFCMSIEDVQIDNQLFEAAAPVVLYATPNSRGDDDVQPAIHFTAEMKKDKNINAVIFNYLIFKLKKISIILEERLLLKLCAFIGFQSQEDENINKDNDNETQRLLTEVCAAHAKRYYFGTLMLIPNQIRLSFKTASKLPKHLQRIKRKLGFSFIKFEDAAVDLEAFNRKHQFETSQFFWKSIVKHFKAELLWQAGVILGSIDFIGNPIGLMNDVTEGVSGLIYEGNVAALVKNVTHGLSNSAAKVTESLSDGLGRVAMDDYHEEMRQKFRQVETGNSKDHILAGFKGLGFGLLGGATGIFKQVYEGASNDGIQGVFSGLGKGLVGAVTKPVVGVLDFAYETARAVRDSSSSKTVPERFRLPRCVYGPGGLLPRFNAMQSQGQQYLYQVNDKDYSEHLISYQVLGSASEDLQCIVSNKKIRICTSANSAEFTLVIDCSLSDLEICNVVEERESFYIEIVMHFAGASAALVNPDPVKKPRVKCRTYELAHSIAQQINYAKRLYIERQFTFNRDNIISIED